MSAAQCVDLEIPVNRAILSPNLAQNPLEFPVNETVSTHVPVC